MSNLDTLFSRKSHNKLTDPAPSRSDMEDLFKAALRAPDHALLKPWRYLVFQGESLIKLGELFAQATIAIDKEVSYEKLEKLKAKPLRAPMVVVSIVAIKEHKKVPEVEQILSAGAGVQNLLMAAHFKGIGAIWRTGGLAFNDELMKLLELESNEQITGFIYLGTEFGKKAQLNHPKLDDFVNWK